jgi:hypothetical protein
LTATIADGLYCLTAEERRVDTRTPAVCLRIVVLQTAADVWCDRCGALSAVNITYVVEEAWGTASLLHRLTYCESCEDL